MRTRNRPDSRKLRLEQFERTTLAQAILGARSSNRHRRPEVGDVSSPERFDRAHDLSLQEESGDVVDQQQPSSPSLLSSVRDLEECDEPFWGRKRRCSSASTVDYGMIPALQTTYGYTQMHTYTPNYKKMFTTVHASLRHFNTLTSKHICMLFLIDIYSHHSTFTSIET